MQRQSYARTLFVEVGAWHFMDNLRRKRRPQVPIERLKFM